MSLEITELVEKHPKIEIVDISIKDKIEIISKVELLLQQLHFANSLDGGTPEPIDLVIGKSLFEFFVRQTAIDYSETRSIARINLEVYQTALRKFTIYMKEISATYDLLRSFLISNMKSKVKNIFCDRAKVFEPYIIGELCDKMYLDNKSAKVVIEYFKQQKFMEVAGKNYGQSLLSLK